MWTVKVLEKFQCDKGTAFRELLLFLEPSGGEWALEKVSLG